MDLSPLNLPVRLRQLCEFNAVISPPQGLNVLWQILLDEQENGVQALKFRRWCPLRVFPIVRWLGPGDAKDDAEDWQQKNMPEQAAPLCHWQLHLQFIITSQAAEKQADLSDSANESSSRTDRRRIGFAERTGESRPYEDVRYNR
jgi:hypothetical protein